MAKKSARSRNTIVRKKKTTGLTLRAKITRFLWQPRKLVVVATLAVGVFFAPTLIKKLPDISQRPEYRIAAIDIEITDPPHWIPRDLLTQIIDTGQLQDELSILDEDLAKQVAQVCRRHPWVSEVKSVRVTVPARIQVQLEYRVPVAMVAVQDGMYPVDANATLLPSQDFSAADTKRYPVVLNVTSTPGGPVGSKWRDVGVKGAARLAKTLGPHWNEFGLRAISIPAPTQSRSHRQLDNIIYSLVSHQGTRIIWGRAPGSNHPGEHTIRQKLGRLRKYLEIYNSFDDSNGPYEIDIRAFHWISRRPLASQKIIERH